MINKLDMMSGNVPRNIHSKQKTRKQNDDVANRIRSKTGHLGQNVGDSSRSKLYWKNIPHVQIF